MGFGLMRQRLFEPLKRISAPISSPQLNGIGCGYCGQMLQVRRHAPIAGPPRWPLSMGQRMIYGWGSLLFMMIIPFWCLFQMPRWSALHNNLPWGEEETAAQETSNEDDK